MKVENATVYNILGFIGGAILSKSGAITLCYYMQNPEPYSLAPEAISHRQKEMERALRLMPAGSYFHKQDIFLRKAYQPSDHMQGNSFLEKATMRHFANRQYLDHHCILAFTVHGLGSLEPAYCKNPLSYRQSLTSKDLEVLQGFLEAVEGVVIILKNLPGTTIRLMEDWECRQFIGNYVNGFASDSGLRDLYFGPFLDIGEARGAVFAISDESLLPDELTSYIEDNTLPKANASLHMAPLEELGVHLQANHIYNQVIYFEGHTKLKNELQARVDEFTQHRRFSKEIEITGERLKQIQHDVIESQSYLCRSHFSLQVWDTDLTRLEKAKEKIREVLKLKGFGFYQPTYLGLKDIFVGNVIGRENNLSRSYFFLTELSVPVSMFINHSVFRGDDEGIFYNDRLFQIPIRLDTWDESKKRIPARNGIYIASTGGGKTSTCLNDLDQEIKRRTKVVCAEFGQSFLALTRLHPDVSLHIDYDMDKPLGVNPFYVRDQKEITADKLNTLTVLVLKFWRQKEIIEDAKQYVSLVKLLQDYYDEIHAGHSFPHFYQYVKENFTKIIQRREIPPAYFDLDSFLHICSQFLPGGTYENVCRQESGNEDIIRDKDCIVFELSKIKKDPFLVSIVLTIIFETVENKILADRSVRGKLYLDEYAETATMKDNFSGQDVHSTVAFFYQKLRKENGSINTIIQSPAQLPDNNFTRSIIANTQLLYVLPTTESVYHDIINTFKINNSAHIQLMKSIRNDFTAPRPYAEVFIRFGDLYATVVRLEFSREKFLAFQTDGKTWKGLDDLFQSGLSMEEAIIRTIENETHEKKVLV